MHTVTKKLSIVLSVLFVLTALFGCNRGSSPVPKPHLIAYEEMEETPVRPIDSAPTKGFEGTTLFEQFEELLEMVYAGDGNGWSRPDMTYALPRIEQTYNAAIHILNRYIRNDFTPLERLHAIHDYLAYTVDYDFETLEGSESGVYYEPTTPAFTAEGALVKNKAVCDGFSRAVLLLCGIEGIRCIRVTGAYDDGYQSVNHAWNKVYLVDEDAGKSGWYNLDVTMDVWHVSLSDGTRTDILNHGYFLVSDADIRNEVCGRHVPSGNDAVDYECKQTYPFHATQPLGIGDYTMEITSQAELNAVFSAVKASKRKIGKIELKLNFPEYDKSNLNLAGAYLSQIRAAYKLVRDADFTLNEVSGVYPYQRYPDGVFVFLIYK